jgi:hypothetical protein
MDKAWKEQIHFGILAVSEKLIWVPSQLTSTGEL